MAVFADLTLGGPIESHPFTAGFDLSLAQAFERVARRFPDRIAVDTGKQQLTYRQLNEAANRLAHRLLAGGVETAGRIAILMAHDAPAIVAVVGIVKAGNMVLALSPGDPAARLKMLMDDAEPSIVVADAEHGQLAASIAGSASRVMNFDEATTGEPSHNPSIAIEAGKTVALVYTSGSTGRSKGVMKTHRQIFRNVAAHSEAMQYRAADIIPLFSALGTGQGTTGVWCALLNGATLCPFSVKTRGLAGLADWIADRSLTVYVSSASIFRALITTLDSRTIFQNIRAVRLASESVTKEDVGSFRRHFPKHAMLVHTLSSSETGNIAWSRWNRDADIPEGRLPVGHVSRDIEVLLLGNDDQPVPDGEVGEIAVKSRYTAAGYWRDPNLTGQRFSQDLDGRGTRLVRNGDWARINSKGQIEYCGRKDDRIKIRGSRIELSDIERALARLPGIDRAAAVAVPRGENEPMLVAFVVMKDGASGTVAQLRHGLAANLPLHMLPSRFVFVDALPLGASGKIDREALRAHSLPTIDSDPDRMPETGTETLLADIWAEVLDLPQISRDDDFFELGGDSLRGAVVTAQIFSALGIEVSLAAIADHPRLCNLAAFIDAGGGCAALSLPPILPVPRTGPMPLSPFQERIWRALQARPGYEVAMHSYRISGPADIEIMEECFRYLADRHEIMRTTFEVVNGQPAQIVHPSSPLAFSFIDLSSDDAPEERAESLFLDEAKRTFDPAVLPTSRYLVIKVGPDEHRLLRTAHPLTQDGPSFTILMHEFAALYEARVQKIVPPIPRHMPLQYIDYAVWHREVLRRDGPVYVEMLSWWKRLYSRSLRTTQLPFRRSRRLTDVDPREGIIRWKLDEATAERLDTFARKAGVTFFVVRLACFVALVADVTGRSTVVIGTSFANRHRNEARNIVGLFTNLVPLIFDYRPGLTLREWTVSVRDRLFETEMHAELPFEELNEQMRASGLGTPSVQILFTMSADRPEQRVGELTMRRRHRPAAEMPWGCQLYVDQRTPDNCRVEFDAGIYPPPKMQTFLDRYLRLLVIASRRPDLPVRQLVAMSSGNRVRRAFASLLAAVSEPAR